MVWAIFGHFNVLHSYFMLSLNRLKIRTVRTFNRTPFTLTGSLAWLKNSTGKQQASAENMDVFGRPVNEAKARKISVGAGKSTGKNTTKSKPSPNQSSAYNFNTTDEMDITLTTENPPAGKVWIRKVDGKRKPLAPQNASMSSQASASDFKVDVSYTY